MNTSEVIQPAVLACILVALNFEKRGAIADRNRVANEIFAKRANRKITINGITVETWWDRFSQCYVTGSHDASGHEVADNDFSGNSDCAAVAHLWALAKAINR